MNGGAGTPRHSPQHPGTPPASLGPPGHIPQHPGAPLGPPSTSCRLSMPGIPAHVSEDPETRPGTPSCIPQAPHCLPQHPPSRGTVLLVSSVEGSQASLQRIRGGQFLGSSSLSCVSSWQRGGQWGPRAPHTSPGIPSRRVPLLPGCPAPPTGPSGRTPRTHQHPVRLLECRHQPRQLPGEAPAGDPVGAGSRGRGRGRGRRQQQREAEAEQEAAERGHGRSVGRCHHRRCHRALMGRRQVGNPRGRWHPPPVTAKSPPPSKAEPIPGRGPRAAPRRARSRTAPGRDGTGRKTQGSSWRLRALRHPVSPRCSFGVCSLCPPVSPPLSPVCPPAAPGKQPGRPRRGKWRLPGSAVSRRGFPGPRPVGTAQPRCPPGRVVLPAALQSRRPRRGGSGASRSRPPGLPLAFPGSAATHRPRLGHRGRGPTVPARGAVCPAGLGGGGRGWGPGGVGRSRWGREVPAETGAGEAQNRLQVTVHGPGDTVGSRGTLRDPVDTRSRCGTPVGTMGWLQTV